MKIFVNPGHGGNDPGACGNGLREADVALKIGRRVEKYLRDVGYDVKLAQIDGLYEICDASNNWGADLFVSIHCNAGGTTGTENDFARAIARGITDFTATHPLPDVITKKIKPLPNAEGAAACRQSPFRNNLRRAFCFNFLR